jgi:glycosyltransferase involved in cell wall biosynthesis
MILLSQKRSNEISLSSCFGACNAKSIAGTVDQMDGRKVEDMKPLSIAMIISFFHPYVGGAERQAQQLASRLLQKGIMVDVLTRRLPGLAPYEEVDGIPVHRVITIWHGALASLSYSASALRWLSQHRSDLDVLHCHQPLSPMTIGLIAKALWDKPVLVKLTGGGSHGNLREIQRLPFTQLRKRMMQRVDRFVAVSGEVATGLHTWGIPADRIAQIPNGVDTDRFAPSTLEDKQRAREALGLEEANQVTIFVGRLSAVKGVDTLLRAWKNVHQVNPNSRLLLLGDGPERTALQVLADELDLGQTLAFCGAQPDVLPYFQAADLFALPSVSEGLPNALLEAMAAGLPCVASNIGGNVDLISHGDNGLLFQPGSVEHLTDVLLRLSGNDIERREFGRRARETVEADYSLDRVMEKYVELYRRLTVDRLK